MTTRATTRPFIAALPVLIAIAATAAVLSGCGGSQGPSWEVRYDPGGLGYWAGPAGGPHRFYPSAYANPRVNTAGGPAR